MTTAQIASAIATFAKNLENCTDMQDRKNSVQWLADAIGYESANKIAEIFGLNGSYYMA